MDCKKDLITWLNNAYSMELSLVETLENHVQEYEDEGLSEMSLKIRDHIEDTKEQANLVKNEIERLGGKISGIKAGMAKVFGEISGMSTEFARDRIVKNAIAEHASEYFETATYMAIAKLADYCGEEETSSMALKIAQEERTTGEELATKIGKIVDHFAATENDND